MNTLTFVNEFQSEISDEKSLLVSGWQMKQLKKQKEEFNGILNDASVRTKMPSSDKVITQDEMHWLKTLIFTHLRFIKAVASDQHNYANNIRMIKGVHKLTLLPNMLIFLIDQFTIFNGWMDSWADPGLFVRGIQARRPDS